MRLQDAASVEGTTKFAELAVSPSESTPFNVLREFRVGTISMATPEGVEPPTLRSEV